MAIQQRPANAGSDADAAPLGRLAQPFKTVLHRDLGDYLICPAERADAPKIKFFHEWLLS